LYPDRNAPAVVRNMAPAIGREDHFDTIAVARHRLVNSIVHEFLDQLMKTGLVRRSDIHTGTATDRFEALEDLDLISRITVGGRLGCHT